MIAMILGDDWVYSLLLRLVGLRVHVHWRLVVQSGVVVAAWVQELHLHSAEMIIMRECS